MGDPLLAWSQFTGRMRVLHSEFEIDFLCMGGRVVRSIPGTKRFIDKPVREVYHWYTRHPFTEISFTHLGLGEYPLKAP